MLSLKQYAEQKNISYEAVRKQVKRYKTELGDHIHLVGRTQFLDDIAIEFLDDRRKSNPVVLIQEDKNERIQHLEAENKALLLKISELQEARLRDQEARLQDKEQIQQLQQEKLALLESQATQEAPKGFWARLRRR